MQTQTKVFPGMLNNSTEFFNSENGLMFINNGQVKSFFDLPFAIIKILTEAISNDLPAKVLLNDWFPNQKMKQLEQFISCRFGGLDHIPDLNDGVLQDGEYHDCPRSGMCAGEGIICKLPSYNGHQFSKVEIKVMQLSTTEMTNEVIADTLMLPLGSFHKIKSIIHETIGAVTKQGITKFAQMRNII